MQFARLATPLFLSLSLVLPRLASAQTPTLVTESTETEPTETEPAETESAEFDQLRQTLESHNFTVTLALPPRTGTYGLLDVATRTVWINPVVFDLGIAIPTLVHEAVHAAQLCNGSANTLRALDLGLEPYPRAYRLYMRYTGTRRTLEAEAYTIQALPNRVPYVINLLDSRCG